jgi:hypothetical protein
MRVSRISFFPDSSCAIFVFLRMGFRYVPLKGQEELSVQSVSITTKVVSSNFAYG